MAKDKIKIEKTVTVVRVWEDGATTDYRVSQSEDDIQIDQGDNAYIYFPKFLAEALVATISEVSANMQLPDVSGERNE